MSKKIVIIIILAHIGLFAKAQNEKKLEKALEQREVIINSKDSLVRCHVMVENKEIKPNQKETYYWYDKNKIQKNVGSYSGKLLVGEYEVTNSQGELMTKGSFKNGQKDGKWLSWSGNGKIKNVSRWNNGKINGKIKEYDTEGTLIQITPFKNNIQHGTLIKYTDKTTVKKHYKKGVLKWEKTIYKVPKRRGMFQIM